MKENFIVKMLGRLIRNNLEDIAPPVNGEILLSQLKEMANALDDLHRNILSQNVPLYNVDEIQEDENTKEFLQSRYNYLLTSLKEDFQTEYYKWLNEGVLTYKILNLLSKCKPVFDFHNFVEEAEGDRILRYSITETIRQHFMEAFVDTEYLGKINFAIT